MTTSAWPWRRCAGFDQAITALQDAAAIYRYTGEWHREGMALNNLGLALRELGRSTSRSPPIGMPPPSNHQVGDEHNERIALGDMKEARAEQQA